MIEIVRGSTDNKPVCIKKLESYFYKNDSLSGVLYFGYPIVKEKTSIDALLITKEQGIIIFDLYEGDISNYSDRSEIRDEICNVIDSMLRKNKVLMDKRTPFFQINAFTYCPSLSHTQIDSIDSEIENVIIDLDELKSKNIVWEHSEKYEALLSAIQVATKIKTTTNRIIKYDESKGAILQKVENSIATLDMDQNKAIIETVDGIQRIRGLAGSGKSIVLALKAAYLYSLHPEYKIVICFNTRALKQLFKSYISKFVWAYTGEDYDESRLMILNSWGSFNDPGLYSMICSKCGLSFLSFDEAKKIAYYRGCSAQEVVYDDALDDIKDKKQELFDIILVDEAQDLPESFFHLCKSVIKKETGKLVIAYDELQNLTTGTSENINSFFKDINISNEENKPKRDIILPVCYRTSKEILVTAHALGFGIYSNKLIQLFDDPDLWKDVGYKIVSGSLTYGNEVVLERKEEASPNIYPPSTEENIICRSFSTKDEEADWIANSIEQNLNEDELSYKDILVIVLQNYDVDKYSGLLRSKLLDKEINTHVAGITTNTNTFYVENSITISSIYRAKGNEAAMVYIMGITDVSKKTNDYQEMKYRNNLFTSITRSKLWVRLSGVGDITNISREIEMIKRKNYKLAFKYPNEDEFKNMIKVYSEGKKRKEKDIKTILGEATYNTLLEKFGTHEKIMEMFGHLTY